MGVVIVVIRTKTALALVGVVLGYAIGIYGGARVLQLGSAAAATAVLGALILGWIGLKLPGVASSTS